MSRLVCFTGVIFHMRLGWFVSQVLAKFLGLLTFRPNWGVPASDAASTSHERPLRSVNEKVRQRRILGLVVYKVFFICRVSKRRATGADTGVYLMPGATNIWSHEIMQKSNSRRD